MNDRRTQLSPGIAIFALLSVVAMALVISVGMFALIWETFQP